MQENYRVYIISSGEYCFSKPIGCISYMIIVELIFLPLILGKKKKNPK